MGELLAPHEEAHLSGGDRRGTVRGLPGGAGQMRDGDDVRRPVQRPVGGRRFDVIDVHCEGADAAGPQQLGQWCVVQQAAAGRVDQYGPVGEQRQLSGIDEVVGLRGEAGVQADHAAVAQQFVEGDHFDPVGAGGPGIGVRVGDQHPGAEGAQHPGDDSADGPVADESDGGAVQLDAGLVVRVEVAAPLAAPEFGIGGGDTPHRGEHQPDGELGGRRGVPAGCEGDGHTVPGGSAEVDIDRAAPGDGDHPQCWAGREDLLGEGSHLGHTDLGAVQSLDDLLLRATGLLDVADRTEGLMRPGQGEFIDLLGGAELIEQGGTEESGADEMVASGEDAHGAGPSSGHGGAAQGWLPQYHYH